MNKVARCKIGAGSRPREPGPDLSVPIPQDAPTLGRGLHCLRLIVALGRRKFVPDKNYPFDLSIVLLLLLWGEMPWMIRGMSRAARINCRACRVVD